MSTLLLVIHTMIALVLIGVVLLQRSEGGALGIGGGGGSGGGFMTGRGAANFLTRVTAGLAIAFFTTSLLLSIIATRTSEQGSILDVPAGSQPAKGTPQQQPSSLPPIEFDMPTKPSAEPPKNSAPEVPQSK